MFVSLNWLQDFVHFHESYADLAHRLTMTGLEVEQVEERGAGLESVVVAHLQDVQPHPQADRLTLCHVDDGQDIYPVVCGAPNHKTGDKVAFARVGTRLPGDFKIKKSKIRGQTSMGMLCSEKELGLSEEAEGIIILDPEAPVGTPVMAYLGLQDTRFEIGLTPNRADCLSHLGVAREIAALTHSSLTWPQGQIAESGPDTTELTSVTIDDSQRCPRYCARLIRGVTIGPSPLWLRQRLETVGIRSINNVVDVTNYVLMELGHPLHAFDFQRLRQQRIEVRTAREQEKITTLDGREHILEQGDLLICDGQGPVALAGIMGGGNSEVSAETVDILLESAYFEPLGIRRTSRRLGIQSDSSYRFERGADVDMAPKALERAVALIQKLAGGQVAQGMLDNYPAPLEQQQIPFYPRQANDLLGLELSPNQMASLLRCIGLAVAEKEAEQWQVTVPNYRHDLQRPVDLVEEIARLNGYDTIPTTMPGGAITKRALQNMARPGFAEQLRQQLVACGLQETVSYSFVDPRWWDAIGLPTDDPRRQHVAICNPLSEDQAVMRTTLVPSMLATVKHNLAYGQDHLRFFELRPVYRQATAGAPEEELHLCVALCGRRDPEGWAQSQQQVDFFDLKGALERLFQSMRIEPIAFTSAQQQQPYLHPGVAAQVQSKDVILGQAGEIHPGVLAHWDIKQPVYLAELRVASLEKCRQEKFTYTPISRYPASFRDTALLVAEGVTAAQIQETLASQPGKYATEGVIFDVYQGQGIPAGQKSIALRVRYQAQHKTLTDDEINRAHEKLVNHLCQVLEAQVR